MIRIGPFTIHSLGDGRVWIDHPAGGGEFDEAQFAQWIEQFWQKEF